MPVKPGAYKGTNYYNQIKKNQGHLSADDLTYFEGQKRQTQQQYGLGLAQNAYQRKTTKAMGGLQRGDLVRQFDAMRRQLPSNYAAGGTLNSGLWQKAMKDYGSQRQGSLAQFDTEQSAKLGGYDISDAQLETIYKGAIDDITSAQAARRATAEALRLAQGMY